MSMDNTNDVAKEYRPPTRHRRGRKGPQTGNGMVGLSQAEPMPQDDGKASGDSAAPIYSQKPEAAGTNISTMEQAKPAPEKHDAPLHAADASIDKEPERFPVFDNVVVKNKPDNNQADGKEAATPESGDNSTAEAAGEAQEAGDLQKDATAADSPVQVAPDEDLDVTAEEGPAAETAVPDEDDADDAGTYADSASITESHEGEMDGNEADGDPVTPPGTSLEDKEVPARDTDSEDISDMDAPEEAAMGNGGPEAETVNPDADMVTFKTEGADVSSQLAELQDADGEDPQPKKKKGFFRFGRKKTKDPEPVSDEAEKPGGRPNAKGDIVSEAEGIVDGALGDGFYKENFPELDLDAIERSPVLPMEKVLRGAAAAAVLTAVTLTLMYFM